MRIYYSASSYASHLRAAKAYRALIAPMCRLVDDLAAADVVVLHHEPRDFASLYAEHPALKRKYVVAYCVWEANELPEAYRRSISHVQEIWTCSAYCKGAFDAHHANVHLIPHVIERDTTFPAAVLESVAQRIHYDPNHTYFLAIALQASARKNLSGLVRAFVAAQAHTPALRLILKTGPLDDAAWRGHPAVISLPDPMRWSEINALYHLASAYVSAHHAEGWGLTLSDAMLFGKPVIATGYSGNLEYMTSENSFLVDFTEEPIRAEDRDDLFHEGMKWAYPRELDLQQKLELVARHLRDDVVVERVRAASATLRAFSGPAVAKLIRQRLEAIAGQ